MSDDLSKMPAGAKPAFLPADYQERDRVRDAAPDLLAALKTLVEACELVRVPGIGFALDPARAAIAKVERR
ncbi:hypothetical protein [Alsobacter sp. R-9]